jgi:hypothetical protein
MNFNITAQNLELRKQLIHTYLPLFKIDYSKKTKNNFLRKSM